MRCLDVLVVTELYLLTRDTGLLSHLSLYRVTIIHREREELIERLRLILHGDIEDALSHASESVSSRDEVGLALQSDDSSEAILVLSKHAALLSGTLRALGGDSLTTLAEDLDSLVVISLSLLESLLNVSKACIGKIAQCLDILHRYIHSSVCSLVVMIISWYKKVRSSCVPSYYDGSKRALVS